jgi:hypothetical protein
VPDRLNTLTKASVMAKCSSKTVHGYCRRHRSTVELQSFALQHNRQGSPDQQRSPVYTMPAPSRNCLATASVVETARDLLSQSQ